MQKMTVEEAAAFFKVSKEAIHNRIRRGTLQAVVENQIKYVLIDPDTKKAVHKATGTLKGVQEGFVSFLQEQNRELLEKIEKLEQETRVLRQDKEQMLIEERERIELIYKEKDEQLKSILNAIGSKFLLEAKPLEEEHFEAEITESVPNIPNIISLKKFLKQHNIPQKKREKIIKKVQKIAKKDPRFLLKEKKIYVDTNSFSYDDLF